MRDVMKGMTSIMKPEMAARGTIDAALTAAGWCVQDASAANLSAARGIALREFSLRKGYGAADYLLYVDGKAAGVIEAKREGDTLTGVETQAEKYSVGLPDLVPAWVRPLPFLYQSTGVETRFTSLLDPEPRSRELFHFYQPQTLAEWLGTDRSTAGAALPKVAEARAAYLAGGSLRARLRQMPPRTTAASSPSCTTFSTSPRTNSTPSPASSPPPSSASARC